jgi:hypothetical protein
MYNIMSTMSTISTMTTMTHEQWKKCTDPDKYSWTYINDYDLEPDERFWASPEWIQDRIYSGYY